MSKPFGLLRKALLTDAVLSGVTGLALALASVRLTGFLSLPAGLLQWSADPRFSAKYSWMARR